MAAYGEISTAAVRPRTRRYEPGRSWRSWRSEAMMAVLNGAAFSRACASVIEPRSSPRRRVTHARCTSTMDRMMITAATSSSTTTVANHMSQGLINTPHPSIPAVGRASFMRRRPARRSEASPALPSERDSRPFVWRQSEKRDATPTRPCLGYGPPAKSTTGRLLSRRDRQPATSPISLLLRTISTSVATVATPADRELWKSSIAGTRSATAAATPCAGEASARALPLANGRTDPRARQCPAFLRPRV